MSSPLCLGVQDSSNDDGDDDDTIMTSIVLKLFSNIGAREMAQ